MKNLLISFSGGETSARMLLYILEQRREEFNIVVVFANTSREREETLLFAHQVDTLIDVDIVWIEAKFEGGKGAGYTVTDYDNAKRNGEVFEDCIKAYGIPNQSYPHCTRELKTQPITRFAKDHFKGEEYYTAIGIRADEIDRVNGKHKELKYWYPLVSDLYTTKQHVNLYWKHQPFRLELKGYEGNCDFCWKKSNRKLLTLIIENPSVVDWWNEMEIKYGDYVPPHRNRADVDGVITFFRGNLDASDLVEMSRDSFDLATDDSVDYSIQQTMWGYDLDDTGGCGESCEAF